MSTRPAQVIAGRYQIVDRIGEGGMGQVLRVRHQRLGKLFALKLMRAELAVDPDALETFKTEARLASTLSHPNIVSVVDFGDDPDWGLFITMELVDGELLSHRIDALERIPVDIACVVARQLVSALEHSHARNIVHADLKPDNILCLAGGSGWHVKLLDFGTAQVATRYQDPGAQITGTPEYMAPERITGGPPAPSNDIYALGVVLYEMLAGVTPFSGDSPEEVLRRHLHEVPEPVGARRAEVLDEDLERIVARALAKASGERHQSAGELLADLDAYLDTLGKRERELAQRVGLAELPRAEAMADAFESLGAPALGLTSSGLIRVANRAMARLLGVERPEILEGHHVLQTPLAAIHPNIREDLRLVAMAGKRIRRRVDIGSPGAPQLAHLLMTPGDGRGGSCMLVVC